jgi:hypothetical protein
MTNEFHKPFIKSLLLVAIITVFAMVSSKYIINYYSKYNLLPSKTLEYSSQKSQEQVYSSVVE